MNLPTQIVNGQITCDRADMIRFLAATRGGRGRTSASASATPTAPKPPPPPDDGYPHQWLTAGERRALDRATVPIPPTTEDPQATMARRFPVAASLFGL